MKIYTKTGDRGDTGLSGGARIGKEEPRMQAIGDVDELNATIGLARAAGAGGLDQGLERIQSWLFDVGAELGNAREEQHRRVSNLQSEELERSMDEQTELLEPLRSFILPGGCALASSLHFARTVCRRAERSVVRLDRTDGVRLDVKIFLNRLSDWLFVAARTANARAGVEDTKWKHSED